MRHIRLNARMSHPAKRRIAITPRFGACLISICGLCGPGVAEPRGGLDPAEAIDAWMQARTAIDQADAAGINDVPGVEGVHLVLRHDGRPVAATVATRAEGSLNPVADAVAALLAEARREGTMGDLPEPLFRSGLATATLELDAAGPFVAMTGRDTQRIGQDLDPAASGLAIRIDDAWHIRFPSALRMTGAAATAGMVGELATVAGLTPLQLTAARQRGQATVYRFDTIDLVQLPGEFGPRHFQRGGSHPKWPKQPRPALAALTLAGRHLIDRLWAGPDGGDLLLGGTYHPNDDQWRPLDAPPRDRAFTAIALRRLGDVSGVPPQLAQQALQRSESLAVTLPNDDRVIESAKLVLGQPCNREAIAALLKDPEAALVERSIAAWAIASSAVEPGRDVPDFLNQVALLPPSTTLQAMPWIGWADAAAADVTGQPQRMEELWRGVGKIALADLSWDEVTADVLPVAAFLASRRHDGDAQGAAQSLRIVRSLLVDSDEAAFFRSPQRATGGVKLAPWDERMPLWSQTMAILLLCEAAEAHEQAERPGQEEPST